MPTQHAQVLQLRCPDSPLTTPNLLESRTGQANVSKFLQFLDWGDRGQAGPRLGFADELELFVLTVRFLL